MLNKTSIQNHSRIEYQTRESSSLIRETFMAKMSIAYTNSRLESYLPHDILMLVCQHIAYSRDLRALRLTCRYFKQWMDRTGYTRSLTIDPNITPLSEYATFLMQPQHFLQSMTIRNITSPATWIVPSWPSTVTLECGDVHMTEIAPLTMMRDVSRLHIRCLCAGTYESPIRVDWRLFPSLKQVILTHASSVHVPLQHSPPDHVRVSHHRHRWITNRTSLRTLQPNTLDSMHCTRIVVNC